MNRLDITTVEAARIHAGIPTEVRRPVENPPRFWSFMDGIDGVAYPTGYRQVKPSLTGLFIWSVDCRDPQPARTAPLGKPGDLLWTAEEYALEGLEEGLRLVYRADRAAAWLGDEPGKVFYVASDYEPDGEWMPANRMPEVYSRAAVRLTAVCAERTGNVWEWVYSVEKFE